MVDIAASLSSMLKDEREVGERGGEREENEGGLREGLGLPTSS